MSGSERLKELLKKEDENADLMLYADKQTAYLASLDKLYQQISNWLTISGEGSFKVETKMELVYDVGLNPYEAPMLEVQFLKINELIAFYPKGAVLLVADGKVEVRSRFEHIELLLKPMNEWQIRKQDSLIPILLTEDSFGDMIADLLGR